MIVVIIVAVGAIAGLVIAALDHARDRERPLTEVARVGRAVVSDEARVQHGTRMLQGRRVLVERVGDVAFDEIVEEPNDMPLANGRTLAAQRVIDYHRRLHSGDTP